MSLLETRPPGYPCAWRCTPTQQRSDTAGRNSQEINVAKERKESAVTGILSQNPGALTLIAKLARSFLDSMIQSDAVLAMTPQQQALCAVCHALEKNGMPRQDVLQRYAQHASSNADEQQSVIDELQVRCSAMH